MPEVAGDAALLVDPASPSDIHAAMRRVLDEPTLRRDLVERGLRRAASFTWEAAAAAHLELYRELLAS
jgi:glycosyltransferase involved in cell wall biosynthesis